jgi:hypothetical protein
MMSFRHRISGMVAVLLALMVQIAVGATVPQIDPVVALFSAETLCHTDQPSDGPDHESPPLDCLLCPFCVVVHAQAVALPDAPVLRPPNAKWLRVTLPEVAVPPLPPLPRPPGQPRAPPLV